MPPPEAEERFTRIVREVIEPLRRYLYRRTDPSSVDDLVSDVLLVCWRRLDDVPAEPLPWVYGVARRCLANARRAEARRTGLFARLRIVDPPAPVVAPGPMSGCARCCGAPTPRPLCHPSIRTGSSDGRRRSCRTVQ